MTHTRVELLSQASARLLAGFSKAWSHASRLYELDEMAAAHGPMPISIRHCPLIDSRLAFTLAVWPMCRRAKRAGAVSIPATPSSLGHSAVYTVCRCVACAPRAPRIAKLFSGFALRM